MEIKAQMVSHTYSGKLSEAPKIKVDESIVMKDVVQMEIVNMIRWEFSKQDVRVGDMVTIVTCPVMHVIRIVRAIDKVNEKVTL